MGATIPVQYPPPNSYVALSAVVLVICGFLNITSILFGIPALALAIQVGDDSQFEVPLVTEMEILAPYPSLIF